MVLDAQVQDKNRPYPPPSNVVAVLHRLRSRNLPERIDHDYFRDAGIPEGSIHRVMFALRFIGLVEDDAPSASLRSIVTSTDEEYRDILAGLIRQAYGEVFATIDPAEDSADRIVNFFRRYTPASQRERMVIFFLGMCREAGISVLEAARQRTTDGGGAARRQKVRSGTRQEVAKRREAEDGPPKRQSDDRGSEIPAALELLVRSLPPEGAPLSAARRKQWLTMAEAALTFVYPEEEEGGQSNSSIFAEEEL